MFFQQILFHQTAYPKYESFLCRDIRGYVYFFIDITPHPFPFQQHTLLYFYMMGSSIYCLHQHPLKVIKLYHRIRTVTSLGDQNFSSPLESYKNTIIHSPSLTKMLLCATSPHLFLSCLELGVTGTEDKGVTFLCSLLGTMNTLLPFPR